MAYPMRIVRCPNDQFNFHDCIYFSMCLAKSSTSFTREFLAFLVFSCRTMGTFTSHGHMMDTAVKRSSNDSMTTLTADCRLYEIKDMFLYIFIFIFHIYHTCVYHIYLSYNVYIFILYHNNTNINEPNQKFISMQNITLLAKQLNSVIQMLFKQQTTTTVLHLAAACCKERIKEQQWQ